MKYHLIIGKFIFRKEFEKRICKYHEKNIPFYCITISLADRVSSVDDNQMNYRVHDRSIICACVTSYHRICENVVKE